MKKILGYVLIIVLCVASVCSGVFCGVSWFKKAHAESHTIGEIKFDNSYTLESFSYSSLDHPIAFSCNINEESDLWYFSEDLEKVPSFNGDQKQYNITLNKYLILEPAIFYRTVSFNVVLEFLDLKSETICETNIEVVISFYNDKTKFELKVYGDQNRQFVERYILDNGFELLITEVNQ